MAASLVAAVQELHKSLWAREQVLPILARLEEEAED